MGEKKGERKIHWLRLVLTAVAFLAVSLGLGYLFQMLLAGYQISQDVPMWLGLLVVFGLLAAVNLTLLPLPFGISIMLVAAEYWNPVLVGLAGSLGASLGEFSGYFFGFLGKKFSIDENTAGYKLVHDWVCKYGMWAIAFISFQPVIPFDIGGFVAGITRMPLVKFLPAVWIGKFPKYLIFIFLGDTLTRVFPITGF
jgi:membrane protein YqaA with SNARE-associated domain